MDPLSSATDVDVLVVGAGPTGLTAACEALRHGLSVRIVDRKAHRSTFSKALVMHARTLEALELMGIADRCVAAGASFEALNVQFGDREPVRVALNSLEWGDTQYPFWLSIPQYETERCLEERLEELGGAVLWRTSLVELSQDADGVTAQLQGADGVEQTCRARWVVGCDGGRSKTRELVGLTMQRESLGKTFVLADAKTTADLVETEGHTWHADEGLLLIVPMPEPGLFRIIAHVADVPADRPLTLDAAYFDDLIRERTGIEFGSHELAWTSQFDLNQGLADDYRSGRVFLAGDAAHVHSPVGGQGMNTGIQDAHNLLWKLALAATLSAEEAEPFLDSYEDERRPAAKAMVQGTSRATKVLTSTHVLLRPLVGVIGSRLSATHRVQQMLGRAVGMLDLGYAASAILPSSQGASSMTPGQRVPNARLDSSRPLHSLFDGSGHILARFSDGVVLEGAAGSSRSLDAGEEAELREALGVFGDGLVLVRPDRCIAGSWASIGDLEAFPPAKTVVDQLRRAPAPSGA